MKSFKALEKALFIFVLVGLLYPLAWAQDAHITYPQDNQAVRGEITARFEGIPDGGYAIVQIDGQFKTATADDTFTINTFPPNFPSDGPHKLTIITLNSAGKQVGRSEVTFRIANNEIDTTAEGVRLRHWTLQDRLDDKVQRYWIDAESNATIDDGSGPGGGGGGGAMGGGPGMPGGGGGEDSQEQYIPAPLDFQVRALVRRIVRDVGMVDGGANIRSVVDRAYQRQRISESGNGGEMGGLGAGAAPVAAKPATKKKKKKTAGPSAPVKAPWGEWGPAPETGQYFVKMVLPTGEEINGTRKAPTIALGDLLPTFPPGEVRPGNTWDTTMTFVGELQSRAPVNVQTRITFTSFENITTPAGEQRRCAKLEARFSMPEDQAMKIAQALSTKAGTGNGPGGMAGAGAPAPGAGMTNVGNTTEEDEANITIARTRVSRVLWFDVERRRVLRSEDTVDTYYEEEAPEQDEGAGGGGGPAIMPGGAGGAGGASSGPKKVDYNLRITSWLDDTVPPPTNTFNGGVGTAHAKDSVQDPKVINRP